MKLRNVKVGQTVKVKRTSVHISPRRVGMVGIVQIVEGADYDGYLTVLVEFPNGSEVWGNHKDIKLIEDVD